MDFGYTPAQEALRREVRAFIAEHVTPEVKAEMEGHNEGLLGVTPGTCRGPAVRELFRKIHARGWRGIRCQVRAARLRAPARGRESSSAMRRASSAASFNSQLRKVAIFGRSAAGFGHTIQKA